MSTTILATKLFVPSPRAQTIHRARLIERLDDGLQRKLTLVSAPAGFGKTTTVSDWIALCRQRDPQLRVAWLSLDEGDSDLTRFLIYFGTALQSCIPSLEAQVSRLTEAMQPPPTDVFLTGLLNDVASLPDDILLVLDDYHLTDSELVDDALRFLVEHLPPQMHLVMTTREDPNLPLARLRVRSELVEVRARDLRFSPAEAAEFLDRSMGLRLSEDAITALEARTEGWIAGLQLAALSVQGHDDIAGFIQAFAGDHRYIVDYLVEEVLERQPEPVRQFLLETAILDRLNGSLCDAVTGQHDGHERLQTLEHGNLFVVPLDDKRHWYRYHHLFADVLAAYLRAEQPQQVATLHLRASVWHEQHGLADAAIRHAIAAEAFERAAALIEQAVPAIRRNRQEATLLAWLQALPAKIFRGRPVLSIHYAGTLLQSGLLDGVESLLQDAEHWLGDVARHDTLLAEKAVVDEEEFRRLPASIAMYRAGLALVRGDVANTIAYGQRVLALVRDEDILLRGSAAGLLGLAYWTSGDLVAGQRWYADCMAKMEQVGHISDAIGCAIALADMWIARGRLRDAMSTYERGLQLATQNNAGLRGATDMHIGLSELYRERNDLAAATQYLMRYKAYGDFAGLPQSRYRWCVAMARIKEAEAEWDGALELLDETERLYMSDFFPKVRPIPAMKARVWVAQGRLDKAFAWARDEGLSAENTLSYLHEFEHLTLARALLAQARRDQSGASAFEALQLLERLLPLAQAGERMGSVIEILMLLALAHRMQGNIPATLAHLERALTLAEPEGYIRLFVDEGPPMAALLADAEKHRIAAGYVRQLLSAFGQTHQQAPVQQALTDPLSERELDVLRLLGTDLSGPEIARELVVSLSTLRTHTQNIYTKLGVNHRRAAVRSAEALGLL